MHTLRPYLLVALLNVSEGMITMLVPPYMDSLGTWTASAFRGVAMVANTISVAADVDESQVSRGLASGIYYASRDLGAILGPVLAGGVAGLVGVEGMLRLVPPLALAAYLVGVVASRRYAPGPAPAPARAQ